MAKARVTMTVGRMACGSIRRELQKAKFNGIIDDFMESSGFLSRDFIVVGDAHQIKKIEDWLDRINED
jgi:hypothetical protein